MIGVISDSASAQRWKNKEERKREKAPVLIFSVHITPFEHELQTKWVTSLKLQPKSEADPWVQGKSSNEVIQPGK